MGMIRSPMNDKTPVLYPEYLSHHGVKGMKWGVRKKRVSSSSKPRKKKSFFAKRKEAKQKKKRQKQLAINREKKLKAESKKKISQMTDAELLKRRERLRLEKEVKVLTRESESTAKQIARKAITKAGEKTLEEITHDVTKYVVGEMLINKKAGVKIVNTNTKKEDEKKDKKS